ncbi:MAG TPA: type II toxin-antitoxin system PemK/MazF family toxin [Clostridiales bacterium]|nr:type II toxin-antitoxin system PemK/MazF family toxin [Clostridiales bacterium]
MPIGFYREGTVIEIDYPFEDGTGIKKRPAVIVDFNETVTRVILLKITSHIPRTPYDYQLQHPNEAGLNKSKTGVSVVRTNHVLTVIGNTACIKLGDLSRVDWINVNLRYNNALINNALE